MGRLYHESDLTRQHGFHYSPLLETRTVQAGGVETRYADEGQGPAVVLIHGFPETLQGWRENVPELRKHFRVMAPDVAGAGLSGKPDMDYTPAQMAGHLRDFLDACGVKKAHLVGMDTGLAIAVAFAGLYPERVDRIVLSSGDVSLEHMRSWEVRLMGVPAVGEIAVYNPVLGCVLENAIRKGFVRREMVSREMFDECFDSVTSAGGRRAALRLIRQLKREESFLAQSLAAIRSPVLVLFGDKDCYFPLEAGRRLAGDLKAEFKVIEDGGHFLQEEKPAEFNRIVADFLLSDVQK